MAESTDMPIDDLLDICSIRPSVYVSSLPYSSCYSVADNHSTMVVSSTENTNETTYSSSEDEILCNQDLTLDKEEIARDLLLTRGEGHDRETSVTDLITVLDMPSTSQSDVNCCDTNNPSDVDVPLINDVSNSSSRSGVSCEHPTKAVNDLDADADDDDDDDDDCDNTDDSSSSCSDDSWTKSISVGAEHQAQLPDLVTSGDAGSDVLDYEERLMWNPSCLPEAEVGSFCACVDGQRRRLMDDCTSFQPGNSTCIRDNEEALKLLMDCNYDVVEALRLLPSDPQSQLDHFSSWSADEYDNFVSGLHLYGKDFYLIHQNKVRTRSVAEIVQFYYWWKRTDRHAAYSYKMSGDRRRLSYNSYESSADDAVVLRDSAGSVIFDRSSSPPVHSLLYTDAKRHDHHLVATTACSSLDDTASTPVYQPVTPAWMISPVPSHLAAYRHPSAPPYDISDAYPTFPVGHMPMSYGRSYYEHDMLDAGYTNGFVDACYYNPCRGGPSLTDQHDYEVSGMLAPPPAKKLCSGSVVVDSSPLHAVCAGDFVAPLLNDSVAYTPTPMLTTNSCSLLSCHRVNVDVDDNSPTTALSSCVFANTTAGL